MADEFSITVSGIDEMSAWFDNETGEMKRKALGKALQAAAEPMKTALRARTPESEIPRSQSPIVTNEGVTVQLYEHLKDMIVAAGGITEKGGDISIGFGAGGYLARWLEYGHRIVGHKPKMVDTGKTVPAEAFMRKALAASADAAVEAFSEVIEGFYNGS